MWRRVLRFVVLPAVALVVAIQLVPYGWAHPNPPVTAPVSWPSPEAEAVARESCYDCHSNETRWPWYSRVAPFSWLVRWDAETGREQLNLSTGGGDEGLHEAHDVVENGSMPPERYLLIHGGARLNRQERAVLIAALESLDEGGGNRGPGVGGGRGRH